MAANDVFSIWMPSVRLPTGVGFLSLTWGIWNVGINFCTGLPRSIYSLSEDISTSNYYSFGLFQTSTFRLADFVFLSAFVFPWAIAGAKRKHLLGRLMYFVTEAHPRSLFQMRFYTCNICCKVGGMNKNWVSEVPEFLVHVHQNVSWYISIIQFNISWFFTARVFNKKSFGEIIDSTS